MPKAEYTQPSRRASRINLTIAAAATLTALIVGGYWVQSLRREFARSLLDRALVNAVRKLDVRSVDYCLRAGANADTRLAETPPPSIWTLVRQHLAHSKPPMGPPVLLMAGEPLLAEPGLQEDLDTPRPQQIEIMENLLRHGAHVNYRDANRNTALNYAAAWTTDTEDRLLIGHGADIDSAGADGNTPLIEAVANRSLAGALLLVSHGANVNTRNVFGYTALINASIGNDPEAVSMLIANGANVSLKDQSGDTAITLAIRAKAPDCVRLLRQAGAK